MLELTPTAGGGWKTRQYRDDEQELSWAAAAADAGTIDLEDYYAIERGIKERRADHYRRLLAQERRRLFFTLVKLAIVRVLRACGIASRQAVEGIEEQAAFTRYAIEEHEHCLAGCVPTVTNQETF